MTTLLVLIYIAFISLGLPDSLLGSAWPIMQQDLAAPFSLAGYVSLTVTLGTIVSSLLSNRLTTRFGTGKVTLVSVAMTAAALLGISYTNQIYWLFLMAVPLGLGAGSVDAALNNFVALHYKSRHMSWLHCFWGIGATAGPSIMSVFLMRDGNWRGGYLTIALIQIALVILLFATLPLWRRNVPQEAAQTDPEQKTVITNRQALKVPYVKLALVSFVFFSATELTTGLWSSSYLVGARGLDSGTAALWTGFFYAGITAGRFLSGLVTEKLKSYQLIRVGQLICVGGAVLLMLPLPPVAAMIGITLMGLGTSPVFPSMLHETPNRFGPEVSGAVMGLQMAFAYMGGAIFPTLFGQLASATTVKLYPYYLCACALVMLIASEVLQRKITNRETI